MTALGEVYMTRQEIDAAMARLGLKVPEKECDDLAAASKYVEEMARLVSKPRPVGAEPLHTPEFPEG
jgi:hypothetical protein